MCATAWRRGVILRDERYGRPIRFSNVELARWHGADGEAAAAADTEGKDMDERAKMRQGRNTKGRGHRGQPGLRGQNLDGKRLSRKVRRGRR